MNKLNKITAKYNELLEQKKANMIERNLLDKISSLEREARALLPYIQAGIDTELHQQKLTDVMIEIEELKGNI